MNPRKNLKMWAKCWLAAAPLALALAALPTALAAQALPEPLDPVLNFDYVAAASPEPVALHWRVLNAGNVAFTAAGGQSSSPTLTAKWRTTAIEPGEYLMVEGSLDPARHAAGHVAEQLLLQTDAGPVRLTAVGHLLAADEAAPAPARPAAPADRSGKSWGYLNGMGLEAIAPAFKEAEGFSEGRAAVALGEDWGYINTLGAFVTETRYRRGCPYHEGLALVRNAANKWGVVDLNGREIVPCSFDKVSEVSFQNGTLGVVKDGHGWLIDGYGRDLGLCADLGIQEVTPLSHGVCLFKKGDKWGVLNAKGAVVLPPTYDAQRGGFRNGRALVKRGELFGYLDESGREVVPCTLVAAEPFAEGKGVGQVANSNYQVFDAAGKVLFEVPNSKSGQLFPYHSGRAMLAAGPELDVRKGYIDASGRVLVKPFSIMTYDYNDGYAPVALGIGEWGYFGWDGKALISFDFDNLGPMAMYEGPYGLGAAKPNAQRPSLSSKDRGRRPPNESVIAPAEGAAQQTAVYQPNMRLSGLPAEMGQTPPPLGGAAVPAKTPAKPAAAKAAAKPAAKPAAPKAAPKAAPRK